MAATRTQSEWTYRSGANSSDYYYFTITEDQEGNLSVRNVTTPTGLMISTTTSLPQTVMDDIASALTTVEDLLAATSALNGTVTFTASTSEDVTFTTALNSSDYGVFLDSGDFVPFKITSKSTTGFTIEAGVTWTGTVRYDLFL